MKTILYALPIIVTGIMMGLAMINVYNDNFDIANTNLLMAIIIVLFFKEK